MSGGLFTYKKTGRLPDDENWEAVVNAINQMEKTILARASFYSNAFHTTSATGFASAALPPVLDSNGQIVQRAWKGSRVVSLWIFGGGGPSINTDAPDFENVLSEDDRIKQISAFNVTAFTFLVTLVN